MLRKKSGFTLLELIVVMAVIAILVAMGAPRFIGYTKDANVTAMKADAKVLEDACVIYNLENEAWPTGDAAIIPAALGLTGAEAKTLNANELSSHIRSLKNEIADFALITKADDNKKVAEGEIIYIGNSGNGLKDRAGNTWFGIGQEIPAP